MCFTYHLTGTGHLQEQAFVSHIVSEGPVVTTRTVNHIYRQLPGTSVRYLQPGEGSTTETMSERHTVVKRQSSDPAHATTTIKKMSKLISDTSDPPEGYEQSDQAVYKQSPYLPSVRYAKTGVESSQYLPGTSVRYVKSGNGDDFVTKQQHVMSQLPDSDSSKHHETSAIRRVIVDGSRVVESYDVGDGKLASRQRVLIKQADAELSSPAQGLTMVKKIVTDSPSIDGSKGTVRTVRRSYHQVETLEGLKTEDLSREMEGLPRPALPGKLHLFS